MIDPTVPVPGVPKPTPDVNEVRLRLLAIAQNARCALVSEMPVDMTLLSVIDMAEAAQRFLPGDEHPSEAA